MLQEHWPLRREWQHPLRYNDFLHAGDHIVAGSDIYGGTYRLLHMICNRAGITVSLATADNVDALAARDAAKHENDLD